MSVLNIGGCFPVIIMFTYNCSETDQLVPDSEDIGSAPIPDETSPDSPEKKTDFTSILPLKIYVRYPNKQISISYRYLIINLGL